MAVGNSTDAQAAADMVTRIRAAMLSQSNGALKQPMTFAGNGTSGNGPTGLLGGWAEFVAADSAASTFEFWGLIVAQVFLKHKATGVIYKVCINSGTASTWYNREKTLYTTFAAKSWCPTFTAYDTPMVMAIQEYPLLQTTGSKYGNVPDSRASVASIKDYLGRPEVQDIVASGPLFGIGSLGLDAGSNTVKLVSGCLGSDPASIPAS